MNEFILRDIIFACSTWQSSNFIPFPRDRPCAPVPFIRTRQTASLIPLSHLFLPVVAFAYLLALHGREAHPRAPVLSCPSPTLSVSVYRVWLIRPRLRRCRGFASKFSPVRKRNTAAPNGLHISNSRITIFPSCRFWVLPRQSSGLVLALHLTSSA